MLMAMVIASAVAFHLVAYLPRPDVLFGVTVPPGFRADPIAGHVMRRYHRSVWTLALVILLLLVVLPASMHSLLVVLTQGLGATVAFMRARDDLSPYAAPLPTVREATLADRPSLPGGWLAQAGPFIILLGAVLYTSVFWDDIPARFATHWNLAGRPNGWTDKSVAGVFRGLWYGAVICGTTAAMSYGVMHGSRLARVSGEGGRQDWRAREVNMTVMLVTEYLVACGVAWAAVVAHFAGEAERPVLPLVFRVAPVVLLIGGMVAVLRARSRVPAREAASGDTTPDAAWTWGRLYFNRSDPALFVERRLGFGYTLNFGNPRAWLFILLVVSALAMPALVG